MIAKVEAKPFFRYARLRELRRLMKEGIPVPKDMLIEAEAAARDPVLNAYRFCNNNREHDATTRWFRDNIREDLRSEPVSMLAIVAFRWFNRVSTWKTIASQVDLTEGWAGFFHQWNSDLVRDILLRHGAAPWVTGSYLIKTPTGLDKLDGVLACIDKFAEDWQDFAHNIHPGETTLQGVHETLVELVPFLGSFMAYQVVSDMLHTLALDAAPDRQTWACPGPGTARGLARVIGQPLDHFRYNSVVDRGKMIALMRCLLQYSKEDEFWPSEWWPWELQTVSHVLCETDKYQRVLLGEGRPRQLYRKGA